MSNSINRKVGIEMEGYLDSYPGDIELVGASIGQDGSLSNDDWDYDEPYGVEIRTEPLTSLETLDGIWSDMEHYGWDVDSSAGTHIHVDISDFSNSEKVKLLRFGKGIERIIFLFVENYRNGNGYCEALHKQWRLIFREGNRHNGIDWDAISGNVNEFLNRNYRMNRGTLWNGRYQWMNVFGSNYPTVEYRLFHAVRSLDELKMQARMGVAICDLVKNSTLEQLEFIIKELYRQESVEQVVARFFEVLNLDSQLPVYEGKALSYLKEKLAKKNEDEVAV